MTAEDAYGIIAVLNAAFPREALEGETHALYLAEIGRLESSRAGFFAARICARNGDHHPTIREFMLAYRQAVDRIRSETPAIKEGPRDTTLPDDVRSWMQGHGIGAP